jgi:capsular polysaccharide biosynthesis protein
MCRVLPLLQIYHRFYGLEIQDVDGFYIGRFNSRNFHKESFERLGISKTKLIQNACEADKLVVAIVNKSTEYGESLSKDSYLFSRNLFLDNISVNSDHLKQRIYVQRGLTTIRQIINEEEIIQLLKKYGFVAVSMDGKAIQEQATLFSQAEAIVAVHGAALTNLLFIQPETKVIELMPYGYTHNCFHIIASYGQANYACLQSEATTIEDRVDRRCLNLYIDPQKLDTLCQTIF